MIDGKILLNPVTWLKWLQSLFQNLQKQMFEFYDYVDYFTFSKDKKYVCAHVGQVRVREGRLTIATRCPLNSGDIPLMLLSDN